MTPGVDAGIAWLATIDRDITKQVQPWLMPLKKLSYYGGALPYEMYIMPGLYVALILALATDSITPFAMHLLPHYMAFSVAMALKMAIARGRPLCVDRHLGHAARVNASKCRRAWGVQSFPSGHALIAAAMIAALWSALDGLTSEDILFGVDLRFYRRGIKWFTGVVFVLVLLHRVVWGFHYVGDVTLGAILGLCIGKVAHGALARQRVSLVTKFPVLLFALFGLVQFVTSGGEVSH